MIVKIKEFEKLKLDELYQILKLRFDTFIVEQNSIYNEFDNRDYSGIHIFVKNKNEIVAYSRIYKQSIIEASLGRVVVRKDFRGDNLGKIVIEKGVETIKSKWEINQVIIHAQKRLKKYYESYGFEEIPNSDSEGEIPHINMILRM